MKKIILVLMASGAAYSGFAQVRGSDNFFAQKWDIEVNAPVGVLNQSPTTDSKANVYPDMINTNISKLKINSGLSYGGSLEGGYFIGKHRTWGIGLGVQYLKQSGDLIVDNFHIEYAAQDVNNNWFRQLVTATHSIKEKLDITAINVPVMIKYKHRFTTKLGILIDAGVMYNVQTQNNWKTDAEFNYEAIYAFASNPNSAKPITYFDNASTPQTTDWLVTLNQYEKHNSIGTIPHVFDSLRNRGYNVALNVTPEKKNGTVNYTSGSFGFFLRPSVTLRVKDRLHFKLGAFYTYQMINNKNVTGYHTTDFLGYSYSSFLNSVTSNANSSFGLNLGLIYFLGEPKDSDFDGKFDE